MAIDISKDLLNFINKKIEQYDLRRLASIATTYNEDTIEIKIEPKNPESAQILLVIENDVPIIFVTIEDNTTLEVPIEGTRYTSKTGLAELWLILETIIYFGAKQVSWKIKNELVKTMLTIPIKEESPITVETIMIHNPFRQKKVLEKIFAPYS